MKRGLALITLAALACSHGESWGVPGQGEDRDPIMFDTFFQHLTFNSTSDWAPAWMPGDSMITLGWRSSSRADGDVCLALLHVSSSSIRRTLCPGGALGHDSTNVVVASAVAADGRVLFVGEQAPVDRPFARIRAVFLGHVDSARVRLVLALPFTSTSNLLVRSIERLAWTSDSTVLFLATAPRAVYSDLQSDPLEIGILTIRDSTATAVAVPGTHGASSVAWDAVLHAAYATFVADGRVYKIDDLATGARHPEVDLSAWGVPRDIQVQNLRLAAIVAGRTFPVPAALYGFPTHEDEGGDLLWMDIGDPAPPTYQIGRFLWFRRLTLATDGVRLVMEGYHYDLIDICGGCIPAVEDTVVTKVSDLWHFALR